MRSELGCTGTIPYIRLIFLFGLFQCFIPSYSKVGLTNPGNICYINSVVQSLYNVEEFREGILRSNPSEDVTVASTLKKVFYDLKTKAKGNAIPLVSLCNMQPGRQEDAQEFLLNLLESLRNDLGDQENSVNIFAGEMTNYIKCKDVMFMKESKERFHDISLDIADYSNLQDALDGFFTPVTLEGSNQYNTKTHGRQDAIKGIRISRLPKVLFIHLKRFGFDIETNEMRKIPKALEFPMNLCLDKYVDITDKVGGNVEGLVSNYQLNAVILHDGNGDAGHYTCFVKTNDRNIHDTWYRLNDEVFGIVDTDTVMEESSGRVPNVQRSDNGISKNGYILQYVKTEKNTD